jgi:predicted amidohydrolase
MVSKICILQMKRVGSFKDCVRRVREYLDVVRGPDFVLLGGELSLNETNRVDPYPLLAELASSYECNIVAPINANQQRFGRSRRRRRSSMHIFGRNGEVLGIQDKQNFYCGEMPWFCSGAQIEVFNVDGVRVGLVRGLDILFHSYMDALKAAEVVFFSTMATDDMMFDLARTRALENRAYYAMSSFVGMYLGTEFVGNAALIRPKIERRGPARLASQPIVMQRIQVEGLVQGTVDISYIREIRKRRLEGPEENPAPQ